MRGPLHVLLALAPLLMAAARADDQVWSELKFTTRLGPHFDLVGAGSLRFTDDASRLGRFSLLAGANWHATDRLTLTPAYSYIVREPRDDARAGEWTINRLFVGIEKKTRRDWVLDIYYAREHDFHGRNPDLDILGISMRFSFDGSAEDS